MEFHEELLDLAQSLLHHEPVSQASLRRAVSTGYYALFHLLIAEAVANWARPEQRLELSRCFDHGKMRTASTELPKTAPVALRELAKTFVQAQKQRHDADYKIARQWTQVEVAEFVIEIDDAFALWKRIGQDPEAQAYLVSLLLGRRKEAL
jgi:uncharacterized protein (UPF0332 family)